MAPSKDPACPLCGEPVLAGARRCDNCGAELAPDELPALQSFLDSLEEDLEPRTEPSAVGRSERRADEASRAPGGSTLYLCPSCGSFVSSSEARCPKCGADLAAETAGAVGRTPAAETRLCARCGSTIPVTAEVCPSCGRPVESDTEEIPGLCPNCGSVTPSGRPTCAVCGVSLRPEPSESRALAPPPAPSVPSTGVPRPVKGSPRP
ncbi:MAG TPA: zinc ribbon domain-containing protein, partial [Thermoplasmata archaeon]|nr:zinc ribbon domain-containing protein [Thermoplasmata archaeon]